MALGRAARAAVLVLVVVLLLPAGAWADDQAFEGPDVIISAANDLSKPLAELGDARPPLPSAVGDTGGGSLLGPVESFEGIANEENDEGATGVPPDTNGAVGPLNYVQSVNSSIAVYDKQGTRLLGPLPTHLIWKSFGGLCETTNKGDAVVRYDQLARRWVFTQYAYLWPTGKQQPPYYQCFAVSKTPDPTGPYYRYAFEIGDSALNDYPKLAVWPDGYYMAANRYENGSTGVSVFAFDRTAMLAGLPAQAISFRLVDNVLGVLPSDLDGQQLPPPGSPDVFVKVDDDQCESPQDQLELWRFSADFTDPSHSTFTALKPLPTRPFDSACDEQELVQQKGTTQLLEPLADRLMFRATYRNQGTSQSLLVMHTVLDADKHTGLRWYELRFPAGVAQIAQQGTYQPDDDSRWMGSIAGDRAGDIALGFSLSGTATYPSIGYAGQAAGDAPGTMDNGEGKLVTSNGSQTGFSRWGDYSSLTVDPVDDCTFWYTQEYYPATSDVGWHTRIGSFRFPGCGPVPTTTGVAREGATLRASTGSWPELPGATFAYQWRRCNAQGATCSNIEGATAQTYAPGTLDVDNSLRVVVTAATSTASASALSADSALIAPVPATAPVALVTTMTATPVSLGRGSQVTYTVKVGNAGTTGSATGVVLTVSLPAGAELVSTGSERGSGCSATQPVVCPLDFIPGGRTATVIVTAQANLRGSLTATASVDADQAFSDPSAAQASATVTVRAAPKLVLATGPPRVSRKSAAVLVSARVALDEPATLTARAVDPRNKQTLPLLAGTALGHTVLHRRRDRITRTVPSGEIPILLRVPRTSVRLHTAYSLALTAIDRDGLTTQLAVTFRS